jgi:A118 family predicted phage portal protein
MNIFNYFKRIGIDTVDASFYRKIAEWISWYEGNVRRFSFYRVYTGRGTYKRCQRKSMGMAKKLSEDIADLLLNERVTITLNDEKTNEFVQQILEKNRFLVMGNDCQERKAFTGTVAYIPYLDHVEITEDGEILSGEIAINYVDAPNIYPVSWTNGRVTECVFTFPHTVARKKYVQVQSHLLENGEYVIRNTVLKCESGSQEGTELSEEEWRKLKPFKTLAEEVKTGSSEPQFVIDRLNITNNADENNPMGIAIFANAIDVLKKLDIEYDSYCNEFELGRKRIFVKPELLTNTDGSPAFDPDDSVFYALPEDDANSEGLLKEVDMTLRAEQHSKAINDDLNYLSLKCGFGADRYQFGASGAKTATEIISENSDMYRMLKKHEILLEDALKQLIRIIIRLGIVLNHPLNTDVEIVINFDDSIIEDKETERNRDRQDVSMGVMSHAEYRAKWYGETLEEATKRLPEQNQVME